MSAASPRDGQQTDGMACPIVRASAFCMPQALIERAPAWPCQQRLQRVALQKCTDRRYQRFMLVFQHVVIGIVERGDLGIR